MTTFAISRKDLTTFSMAGTEGTGLYKVIANSDFGRVGVRDLGDGRTRVRVEPKNETGAAELAVICAEGWKQPGQGGQPRYSRVVPTADVAKVVQPILDRLAEGKLKANPALTDWDFATKTAAFNATMAQSTLVLQVAALGVKGSSIADNWPCRTLRAKLAAFSAEEIRAKLIAKVKAEGVKGANLAKAWSTDVLWHKVCHVKVA